MGNLKATIVCDNDGVERVIASLDGRDLVHTYLSGCTPQIVDLYHLDGGQDLSIHSNGAIPLPLKLTNHSSESSPASQRVRRHSHIYKVRLAVGFLAGESARLAPILPLRVPVAPWAVAPLEGSTQSQKTSFRRVPGRCVRFDEVCRMRCDPLPSPPPAGVHTP